jgi:hypothetical protein
LGGFIAECKLSFELTSFAISGKVRIFVRVGCWTLRHPVAIPKHTWSKRKRYKKPRLWITALTMAFACSFGNLELPAPMPPSDVCGMESNASSSSSTSSSDESGGENSLTKEKTSNKTCLPAPPFTELLPETDFPLFAFS